MYNKIVKVEAVKASADALKLLVSSNGWQLSQKTLQKQYKFANFEDTWSFLTKVSMRSHLMGHHPTITNTYNIVKIELTTHDIDDVSEVDLQLAKRFDKYAA